MTTETTPQPKPSKPAYIAYHVRDGNGASGFFTRVGAAWPNADGKGFNLQLDLVPLDGRITLRLREENSQ